MTQFRGATSGKGIEPEPRSVSVSQHRDRCRRDERGDEDVKDHPSPASGSSFT